MRNPENAEMGSWVGDGSGVPEMKWRTIEGVAEDGDAARWSEGCLNEEHKGVRGRSLQHSPV
jgi:hypothetical protein